MYDPKDHKSLNHDSLKRKEDMTQQDEFSEHLYRNIPYLTAPLDRFDILGKQNTIQLLENQSKAAKEEAALLLKHSLLTRKSHDTTLSQYQKFFFHD